jgi:PAS domain S-box-containing protein
MTDEQIVDAMADALIVADRSGVIRRWNHAATALFGFEAEEALGQSLDLIVPEPLRAAHWRGFDAAMASGRGKLCGHATRTRAVAKDGSKRYVEMSFAVVKGGPDGAACGATAVARRDKD